MEPWSSDRPRDYRYPSTWLDAATDLRYVVMVCRRATFYV